VVGLALGTAGITALILAIIQGPSWGWRSSPTLVLFGAAVLLLSGFANYELGHEGPLLNVRIFNNRTYSASAGAMATNFFCLFGFIFLVTQYFQLVRATPRCRRHSHFALRLYGHGGHTDWGPRRVASRDALRGRTGTAGDRRGAHVDVEVGGRRVVPGSDCRFDDHPGRGFSLVNAPSVAATMDTLEPDQIGAGAAGNETTRELGGTLGVAIIARSSRHCSDPPFVERSNRFAVTV